MKPFRILYCFQMLLEVSLEEARAELSQSRREAVRALQWLPAFEVRSSSELQNAAECWCLWG